ncbi:MAG TPA: hypothetical protein VK497_03925 [Candidatus Saccharimonadales bacterium]|nr:hypothetical protein [Candidatus Saccharimonadales bacterium]
MNTIKRGLFALTTTLGLAAGIGIIGVAPASAESGYYVLYPVEATSVCRYQGSTGATSIDWGNPYSLTCYDLSIPAGVTFGGDLDIQAYCNAKWPGSVATVYEHTIFGWKCQREEQP